MAGWRQHVAGIGCTVFIHMMSHASNLLLKTNPTVLAFTFLPIQMYACLYLILFHVTYKTRNRLNAVLNINSVLAEGSLLLTGLSGWPCESMPQLLQYTVLNLLIFPLFHTQRIPLHLVHIVTAVIVTSLVVAGPRGMCMHVAQHHTHPSCGRILVFTKRCCTILQTVLSFTSNAQLTGFIPASPCRPVCLLIILCCAAISTFVLYHTECHSRIMYLLTRRVAPASLLVHHRQLMVRDLTLAAPLLVYFFWMLCYFTGGQVHPGGGGGAAA